MALVLCHQPSKETTLAKALEQSLVNMEKTINDKENWPHAPYGLATHISLHYKVNILFLRHHTGNWSLGNAGKNIISYIQGQAGYQSCILLRLCALNMTKMEQQVQYDKSNLRNKNDKTAVLYRKNRMTVIKTQCPAEKINHYFEFKGFDDIEPTEEVENLQSSQNKSADVPPTLSQSPVKNPEIVPKPPPLQKAPNQNDCLRWSELTDEQIDAEVKMIRSFLK